MIGARIEAIGLFERITRTDCSGLYGRCGEVLHCFRPSAEVGNRFTVVIPETGKRSGMELADEAGYFAALIPKKIGDYTLKRWLSDGRHEKLSIHTVRGRLLLSKRIRVLLREPIMRPIKYREPIYGSVKVKACILPSGPECVRWKLPEHFKLTGTAGTLRGRLWDSGSHFRKSIPGDLGRAEL